MLLGLVYSLVRLLLEILFVRTAPSLASALSSWPSATSCVCSTDRSSRRAGSPIGARRPLPALETLRAPGPMRRTRMWTGRGRSPRERSAWASGQSRDSPPAGIPAVWAPVRALLSRSRTADGNQSGPPPPSRIQIPRIGVSASAVKLPASPDLKVPVPPDPAVAGCTQVASIQATPGQTVAVGQLDSDHGPAVFSRLAGAAPWRLDHPEPA